MSPIIGIVTLTSVTKGSIMNTCHDIGFSVPVCIFGCMFHKWLHAWFCPTTIEDYMLS